MEFRFVCAKPTNILQINYEPFFLAKFAILMCFSLIALLLSINFIFTFTVWRSLTFLSSNFFAGYLFIYWPFILIFRWNSALFSPFQIMRFFLRIATFFIIFSIMLKAYYLILVLCITRRGSESKRSHSLFRSFASRVTKRSTTLLAAHIMTRPE